MPLAVQLIVKPEMEMPLNTGAPTPGLAVSVAVDPKFVKVVAIPEALIACTCA